ncbi:hypothetical protein CDL12_30298 [Handroanthus impetiginosus]|uniref:Mitochondrial/chloroplast ribosomal protein L17 n=1 Tax=Handroanthus impetiginosus TaxID=429701 RepID=A0A2G9FWH0_9LAMI|nr:hypothetical protein CDL12_30298 [Handroanthus impetiginosus]
MTKFRKLNRPTGHRMSMLRTMVSQLVKHERIETTVAKAKEVRRLADNMVQLGKEGSLRSMRRSNDTTFRDALASGKSLSIEKNLLIIDG